MVDSVISPILGKVLADYFINFNSRNFKTNFFRGEISLTNLIFNQKILQGLSLPLRLKFGMLGKLTLQLPSLLSLSDGLKIQISDVFLCLEMLEVSKWSEEQVVKKYQYSKNDSLKTLQHNTDIVYADLGKEESSILTTEFLHKTLANIKIEIQNVCLMFEDQTFNFSTGLLLPKIEVNSLNELWEKIEKIEDPSVIIKQLTIADVSFFVNRKKFQSVDFAIDLWEEQNDQDFKDKKKRRIKPQKDWTEAECIIVCNNISQHIENTFKDSKLRLKEKQPQLANEYIFQDKAFCIDLIAQVTLNKLKAQQQDPKFNQPDLKLDLVIGGLWNIKHSGSTLNKAHQHIFSLFGENEQNQHEGSKSIQADHELSLAISEEQVEVLLFFGTIMSSYNNYSQGVIKKVFLSSSSKKMTLQQRNEYMALYHKFLESKTEAKVKPAQLEQILDDLKAREQDFRTDLLVRMRKAVIEYYFTERKALENYNNHKAMINQDRSSWYSSTMTEKSRNEKLDKNQKQLNDQLEKAKEKYQQRLGEINSVIADQFMSGDQLVDLGSVEIQEIKVEQETAKWTQINILMPKATVRVQGANETTKRALSLIPMCILTLTGIEMHLTSKTLPDVTDLQFYLTSIEVKDPRANHSVRSVNQDMPQSMTPQLLVIETCQENPSDERVAENIKPGKLVAFNLSMNEVVKIEPPLSKQTIKEKDDNPFEEHSDTDLESENERFMQQHGPNKEMKTSIKLDVTQRINIFANFFFIKSLLQFTKRVVADMNLKKLRLLENATVGDVKRQIQEGSKVGQRLAQFAKQNMERLKNIQLRKTPDLSTSVSINMVSPRLIIDEFLLSEKVVDMKKPCYFMLDMGHWQINTSIISPVPFTIDKSSQETVNVELEPNSSSFFTVDSQPNCETKKAQPILESLNMIIRNLKVVYSFENYHSLFLHDNSKNFVLFDKFCIGFQYQTLVLEDENQFPELPRKIINLKFQKLKLNLERLVFRQLLKIKTFLSVGTFNDSIKDLIEELSKDLPEVPLDDEEYKVEGLNSKLMQNQTDPRIASNKKSAARIQEDDPGQTTEQSQDSVMRVNLLFQGIQIVVLNHDQHKSDPIMLQEQPYSDLSEILVLDAQKLQISVNLNPEDDQLSVVVLLSKLKIKDLEHKHYFYKNITRLTLTQNDSSKKSQDLAKTFSAPRQSSLNLVGDNFRLKLRATTGQNTKQNFTDATRIFRSVVPGLGANSRAPNSVLIQSVPEDASKDRIGAFKRLDELFSFVEFNSFYPRQEFARGQHQVAVYFYSSCTDQQSKQHQMKLKQSSTIVKFQPLQLVGHFELIGKVMQAVFDLLHDLDNVETLYKEHVQRSKRALNSVVKLAASKFKRLSSVDVQPTHSFSQIMSIDEQNYVGMPSQVQNNSKTMGPRKLLKLVASFDAQEKEKRERFVFEESKLVISMPKLSLSIPTNLEDENCLTLQTQTDFILESNSQSQHFIIFQDQLNSDKVMEEVVVSDKILDQLSQTTIQLNQLQLFMRTFIEGKVAQDLIKVNSAIKKGKFLKDFIISPLNLKIQATKTTFENHDLQIHKRHLVSFKQDTLQAIDYEFKRREKVKDALYGTNAEKIVLSDTKIDIANHFKLQLRVRQMKNYFQLIQLILYQQNLIVAVSATPYVDDFSTEEYNQKQNLQQNLLLFKDTVLYNKPSGHSVRSKLLHLEHEPFQDPRNSEPDDSEDIMNLSIHHKKSVEPVDEIVSLDELVQQNRNKEHDQAIKNSKTTRSTTLGLAKKKNFVIVHQKLFVDTQGLAVSLLDDITSQYEESLLSISFSNLDLHQSSLAEQEQNRTLAQREKIQEMVVKIFLKSKLVPLNSNQDKLFQQNIQITMNASYFNHKSFGEEMLLEQNTLQIEAEQADHRDVMQSRIISNEFLNLNVSYGCMLSIYKVISALIEEEVVYNRMQTVQNPYGTGPIIKHLSESKSSEVKSLSKVQESDEDESVLDQDIISQKDLSRSHSFQVQDLNDDGQVDVEEVEDAKKRSQFMPRFKFSNCTGKKIKFKIQNEDHDQVDAENNNQESNFSFTMEAGESFLDDSSSECKKIRRVVKYLLQTFKTDDLKHVQLYLDFQVEGYQTIENISLNQFGLFGYNLMPENKKSKNSSYGLVRLIRNRGETVVYFESNCVVHNSTLTQIILVPFDSQGVTRLESPILIKPNQVQVLPLTWFEQNFQVQLVDVTMDLNFFQPSNAQYLFQNGGISKVLNPTVTNPYYNHARKINFNGQWLSLELALLATRTEFSQFLILIQPLTSFHNLTFFPIEIKACQDGKIKKDSNTYSLKPNESASIKELDLSTTKKSNQCFNMTVDVDNQPENRLTVLVDQAKIKGMSRNKMLNVQKCIIIEPSRALDHKTEASEDKHKRQDISKICCVMEKVPCLDGIIDTEYNNFSLRKRIFHQLSSERYEFYTPFVVVNQTLHDISLLNFDRNQVGVVGQYDNILLDFKNFSKTKLHIKVKDHEMSDKMDMLTAGIHGTLTLKREAGRQVNEKSKHHDKGSKSIEIGTSIKFCSHPFTKTRVIRFTKRFQVINTLRYPIVLQEPMHRGSQFVIGVGKSMVVDFHDENSQKLLQVRMSTKAETEKLGSHDWTELNDFQYFVQQTQWSIQFCGANVDDFQVSLPRIDNISEKEPKKRGWANQFEDKKIVRISITTDTEFTEKLYCVVGRPMYPDYLFLNYLNDSIFVQQKLSKEEIKEQHQQNQIFQIGKGNKSESPSETPAAMPLILNPLKQNKKKKLEITLNHDGMTSAVIQYTIDDPEADITIKHGQGRSEREKTIKIRTRVAGNMRIIELFKATKLDKLKISKTLTLEDQNENIRIKELEEIYNMNVASKDPSEDLSAYKLTKNRLHVKLAGIGVSLIDFTPVELCYISIDKINFEQQTCQVEMGGGFQKCLTLLNLTINNFQIDAMQNKIFPVLLGPKIPFRNIERLYRSEKGSIDQTLQNTPIIQFKYEGTNQNDGNITTSTIENLNFCVQELDFKLHINFVLEIQALLMSLLTLLNDLDKLQGSAFQKSLTETQEMMNGKSKKIAWQDSRQSLKTDKVSRKESSLKKLKIKEDSVGLRLPLADSSSESSTDSKNKNQVKEKEEVCTDLKPSLERNVEFQHPKVTKIFVNSLKISSIKFFMTLRIRGIEQTMRKGGPMGFILNLGSNFADISDAEFSFTDLEMIKQQMSDTRLTENLINHFKGEAIQQFYQVLGSQDIIGNPSNFLTNITQGAEDLQNQPLQGLIQHDARLAAQGISRGVVGLLKNTTVALSSSYSGISGSLYLGLRNLSGAGLTHSNLDQPLTLGGGLMKGGAGFFHELKGGLLGIYKVPQQKVRTQGFGAPQLARGILQGVLQTTLSPINSPLRFSYNISTGIKNQVKGIRDHGQRYRYPRFFDQTERMPPYDHQKSHAQHALTIVKNGKYRNEVVEHVFDTSTYTQENFQGFFKDRVLVITNKSLFFIEINNNKLLGFVSLGSINGMMFYFQDNRSNSIVLESKRGIVRFETGLPEQNQQILKVLKIKLEQISILHAAANQKVVKSQGLLSIISPESRNQKQLNPDQPKIDSPVFDISMISGKQDDGVPRLESKPDSQKSDDEESGESYLTWETIREEEEEIE